MVVPTNTVGKRKLAIVKKGKEKKNVTYRIDLIPLVDQSLRQSKIRLFLVGLNRLELKSLWQHPFATQDPIHVSKVR